MSIEAEIRDMKQHLIAISEKIDELLYEICYTITVYCQVFNQEKKVGETESCVTRAKGL